MLQFDSPLAPVYLFPYSNAWCFGVNLPGKARELSMVSVFRFMWEYGLKSRSVDINGSL